MAVVTFGCETLLAKTIVSGRWLGNPSRGKGGHHASLETIRGRFGRRRRDLIGQLPLCGRFLGALERIQRNRFDTDYHAGCRFAHRLHRGELSSGSGKGSLQVNKNSIDYTLMYSEVGTTSPNTGTVTQAHIHFGKSRDSGGIMVFFCSNLGNGPTGTQKCPLNSGTVTGTWTAASVVGPAAQNIAAGNFAGLVDALNSNTAYANVHTTFYKAGEIRGQVPRVEQEDQQH